MNLFRRLDATSEPVITALVDDTSRTIEATTGPANWVPAPEYSDVWAALAVLADNPGVLNHTTPGLPAPANLEETL